MECGFHIWKPAVMNLFFKCVYVWGTLHAGYLLNGMLNSALQGEECKRGRRGRRRIQKSGKSCKMHFFRSTEVDFFFFARFEASFSFKGALITHHRLLQCWGVRTCGGGHCFQYLHDECCLFVCCVQTLKWFKALADFCWDSKLY